MPTINRSALVPYSASKMFDLVLDVDSYAGFLPWCAGGEVIERDEHHQLASVRISGALQKSEFTTRNTLSPVDSIGMELVEGPFRHLRGQWKFAALSSDACKITLEVDYEFASATLASAIRPVFTGVASSVIDAFVAEAGRRYKASPL